MSNSPLLTTEKRRLLVKALVIPSPATLWQLKGDLLEVGVAPEAGIWPLLDAAFHYFSELSAKASARQYSHFASVLDIAAVGGVALQNILDVDDPAQLWSALALSMFSESMMVMAARQYVKAWEVELDAVYQRMTWELQGFLWELSARLQPELPLKTRRHLLDQLLLPLYDGSISGMSKAVVIGRLFQVLLIAEVALIPAETVDK